MHEGGYLGFEVTLDTDALWADNSLEVKVTLPSNDRAEFPDHPFQEIPHGKQSWYGPMGGIWQSVWLERRPCAHLGEIILGADLATGAVGISVAVSRGGGAGRARRDDHRPRRHDAVRTRVDCAGRALVPLGLTVAQPAGVVARPAATCTACRPARRRHDGARHARAAASASARSRRRTASSCSTASRSTCAARSTRITTRRASTPSPTSPISRTSSGRRRRSGSTPSAATSRSPTRCTTTSATGSGCWCGPSSPTSNASATRRPSARGSPPRASSRATATTRRSSRGRSSTRTGARG